MHRLQMRLASTPAPYKADANPLIGAERLADKLPR